MPGKKKPHIIMPEWMPTPDDQAPEPDPFYDEPDDYDEPDEDIEIYDDLPEPAPSPTFEQVVAELSKAVGQKPQPIEYMGPDAKHEYLLKSMVDQVMRELGEDEDVKREATNLEMIGLALALMHSQLMQEHGANVQWSDGLTLGSHRKAKPACPTCIVLGEYDQAMNRLRGLAEVERLKATKAEVEAVRADLGLCVECGKPPVGGRKYSLDEGFMCADCAGPHLLMDDGQPGNAWS